METNNFIRVCGSIIKKESIIPIQDYILENTTVAEANLPYNYYYGNVPKSAKPNSLFFFTKQYYTLEEVLRFSQKIDLCALDKINVATSMLDFSNQQLPAIRIKNLPDYKQLSLLQKCFLQQGVQFAKKMKLENEALIKTNKCFILEEVEKGIFMDYTEENKGYILIDKLLNQDEFDFILQEIKNNSNYRLFDAEKGGIILNSEVHEIMRVFSEKLDITLLKSIQSQIHKYIPVKKETII
jgi:hypothetical protein